MCLANAGGMLPTRRQYSYSGHTLHSLLIKLLYDTVDKIVHDCLYGLLINMITLLCQLFMSTKDLFRNETT